MNKKAYNEYSDQELKERLLEAVNMTYNTKLALNVTKCLLIALTATIIPAAIRITDVRLCYLAVSAIFFGAGSVHLRHHLSCGRFCFKSAAAVIWGALSFAWVCVFSRSFDRINDLMHIFFLFFGVALIVLNYADAWLRKIRCDIPCELRFAMNEYTGKREPTVFIEDRTIVFDQNEDFLSPGYGGVIRFFINSDNVSEMYCKELFRSAKLSAWLIGGMWCAFVGLFLLAMKIG
ncbi:hypothetical protein [Ruminococcus sp.]|uniref:hypothetical protein n=1 Tax=Ruminococcus sp. TaxID=41978 RepID=UPI0025D172D0|nr:hypothetical protein [Ruminococcus sp.]